MSRDPKVLRKTMEKLNKEYGDGTISLFSDTPKIDVESVSSGIPLLDDIIGCGGFPLGRIINLAGPFASGKSTVAMTAVASYQRNGKTCAYIDAEFSYPREFAETIGVDHSKLVFSQPNSAEEGAEILRRLVESGQIDLVILDSIAAMSPQKELEGEMSDATIGIKARLMSKLTRTVKPSMKKNNCTIIFLNQIREKIGVLWGSNEAQPGGRAVGFEASLMLDIRKGEHITKKSKVVGHVAKIKITKNKLGGSVMEKIEVPLMYGIGFDPYDQVKSLATDKEIIERRGSYYYYNDEQLCQGADALVELLRDNEEFYKEILDKLGLK